MKQLLISILALSLQFFASSLTFAQAEEKKNFWDQAETKCMEVFNKSFANNTDSLSTCRGKPGINANYSLSLDLWKLGVKCGALMGDVDSSLQGALDAETAFKVKNNNESSKYEKIKDRGLAAAQKQTEENMGKLPDCVRMGIANGLLESGKSCGTTIQLALTAEKYKIPYESVCLSKITDVSKCTKLTNEAYMNYLQKLKQAALN